ncbi:ComE operon protein 3 [Clostridiales bacterium]|nr:ComE operon protein 3 [Clostridiales bacterium]
MRRPFVWFTISLTAGILLGRYNMLAPVLIIISIISIVCAVRNKIWEPISMAPLVVIGFVLCQISLMPANADVQGLVGKDVTIRGVVRERRDSENGRTLLRLDTEYIEYIRLEKELTLFVTAEEADVRAGDIVEAKARLYEFRGPTNPYESNYRIRMLSEGYDYSAWCKELKYLGEENGFLYSMEKAREYVNSFFENLPAEEAGIAKALTTGYKYDIDKDTRELFKNLGISHVLAVSGLHVSVIAGAVIWLLTRYLNMDKRKTLPLVSLLLIIYLIFTGASPSAMRAVIMSITAFAALMLYKNSDSCNTIAFSAFIMLCINPLNLWNISFQLSYMGISAVVTAKEILKDMNNSPAKTVMFSMIIWIITTPLVMYYFGGVSLVSVISNIIAVPYLSVVTGLALGAGMLSMVYVGELLATLVHILLKIYIFVAGIVSTNGLYMNTAIPSFYSVICIYVFFIFCTVFRKVRYTQMAGMAAVGVSLCIKINGPEIVFFDSGQGDASVIYIPQKFTAIIDGGPEEYSPVTRYIKAKEGKADILFISHMDKDHSEGAIGLIERNMVKIVVISDVPHSDRIDLILKAAGEQQIPVFFASQGDTFVSDSCYIECLYPKMAGKGENSTSLVLKADIDGTSVIFTGDIERADEISLLNSDIECDIIKVAHHGSNTSSIDEFIEKTGAAKAIIQAGEDNLYGFPHADVMDRLESYGIDTYVTGYDGAVTVRVKDGGYDIKTYRQGRG